MKFKSLLVGVSIAVSATFAHSLETASDVIDFAISTAKSDGLVRPEIIVGILMQESRLGDHPNYKVVRDGTSTYYGLGQITIGAAKDVIKKWPNLLEQYEVNGSTKSIKEALANNRKFNIEVASKYLAMIQERFGFTSHRLINAYNLGPGSPRVTDKSFYYYRKVESHIRKLGLVD